MLKSLIAVLALGVALAGYPIEAKASGDTKVTLTASKPIQSGIEVSLYSKVLNEQRKLLIHLPEGYEQSPQQTYPVLLTLDGQTHFKHMSGTVDWLSESAARIPRLIVVALTNTNRGRDMTASHNNGGGDLFIQFIANELIPFLNDEYRTKPFRILAGHSMAGHLALNVLEQKPELFNAYIAMSPFFHQDRGERKLAEVLANKVSKPEFANRFLYLSIGDEIRLKPKYDVLVDALSAKANPSLNWYSKTSNTDSHMSIVSNTVNEALQFVFAPQGLSPDSETAKAGVESIKAYYKKLSNEKYGYEISPEGAINRLGYHWLWEGNTKKAIAIFEANTKEFPSSPNVYDSLAEAYQRDKKLELALATIHRAIALGEAQKLESVRWMKRREQRIKDALSSVNE